MLARYDKRVVFVSLVVRFMFEILSSCVIYQFANSLGHMDYRGYRGLGLPVVWAIRGVSSLDFWLMVDYWAVDLFLTSWGA
jgi:hypothetical protein